MKKILITGGAGFIGYYLALMFLKKQYKVHLIDNFDRGVNDKFFLNLLKNKNVKFFKIDLLNANKLLKLDRDYTYIFHLAAIVGVKNVLRRPYDVLNKNYLLLKNIIDCAKNQKKLERFIFFSTSEVYACTLKDFSIKFPTPETTKLSVGNSFEERNTYMLSKIYGEAMCIHSNLPVTIIRPHNFYGPRMGLSHVIPELLKQAHETKNGIIEIGNTNHKRTFCYITDAIEIIYKLTSSKKTLGGTYNVGDELNEITINQLGQKVIETVDKKIKIRPIKVENDSPKRRCPSMLRANKAVKYRMKTSLTDGLKICYKWYSKNVFNSKEVSSI